MESNEVQEQLAAMERAEAASWIEYPTTPAWWPPAFGVWTVAYVLAVGLLGSFAMVGAMVVLAFVAGLAVSWQRQVRGSWPTGKAPREINRLLTVFVLGCLAMAATLWLVGETVGVWPAAVLGGVLATALVWWYEAAYARAAAAVRRRLA